MQQNKHPEYHEITVVMTDGTEFKTRSTWGKAGDKMTLLMDPKNHPAWTGNFRATNTKGRAEQLMNKYGMKK